MTAPAIEQVTAVTGVPSPAAPLSITASSEEWLRKLRAISPAVSTRPPVPILSAIVIRSAAGQVTLTGYNYETSAVATLNREKGKQEDTAELVPMSWLARTIRTLTKGKPKALVTVAATHMLGERLITVSAEGYTLPYMNRMPLSDYPALPMIEPTGTFSMDRQALAVAMERVSIAASADDTLPILTAINIRGTGKHLSLQATDRYRLAAERIPHATEGPEFQFLLQGTTWKAIRPHLNGDDVTFDILDRDGRTYLGVSSGDVRYVLMGVDGDYPKIDPLFADAYPRHIEVDRRALLDQVTVARELGARNLPAHVFMTAETATVRPSLEDIPDAAAITTPLLPAKVNDSALWAGDPAVGLNPNYFHEALRSMDSEKVRLSFLGENMSKPVCFTAGGVSGANKDAYRHLIMPVRMPNYIEHS
jgi:DNA polymerase-3 subunit beta